MTLLAVLLVLGAIGTGTAHGGQRHPAVALQLTFEATLVQTIIQQGAGALPEQRTSYQLASSETHQALWQSDPLTDGRYSATLSRFVQQDQYFSEPFFNNTVCFQFSAPSQNSTAAWRDATLRALGLYDGVFELSVSVGSATVDGVACEAYQYTLGDTKPGDTLVTYWVCVNSDRVPIAINLTNYIKSDGSSDDSSPYYVSVQSTILNVTAKAPEEALFAPPQRDCVDLTSSGTAADSDPLNDRQQIDLVNSAAAPHWFGGAIGVFEGSTVGEFRNQRLGTHIRPLQLPLAPTKPLLGQLEQLPERFDAGTRWAHCASIGRISDQARCGSCWAWAAAEVFADRSCIQHAANVTPSVEFMLDCDQSDDSCGGGLVDDAWKFLVSSGVPTAVCDPYTAANGTGQSSCPTKCADGSLLETHKAKSAYAVAAPGDVQGMQREMMAHGPIQVAFYVFSDFVTYSNGTYFRTHAARGPQGGHSVKIVGWGVDEHGIDYWRVANSWGATWGEAGFFRIRRGTNECGIETTPVAGIS